jgi:hypothetical protein
MTKIIKPKAKNYIPDSIGFAEGFLGPKGDVGFFMVADWEKAKSIIEALVESGKNIDDCEMGLDGDWNENSMTVYENGEYTPYSCYECSQWAEPILIVNYSDAPSETYSVWFREEKQ